MSSKFYKLPEWLLRANLTPRAMIAYCVLADRAELSGKNGSKFRDKHGLYILYRRSDLCAALGVGDRTARYILAELEDEGYIKRKKQGKGLPGKIYICDRQEIADSDRQEIADSDRQDSAAHINTNNNNTDLSSSSSSTSELPTQKAKKGDLAKKNKKTTENTENSKGPTDNSRFFRIFGQKPLIKLIVQVADREGIELTTDIINRTRDRVEDNKDKIRNLEKWMTTNLKSLYILSQTESKGAYDIEAYESQSAADKYKPAYSIEEFENTNIEDEIW